MCEKLATLHEDLACNANGTQRSYGCNETPGNANYLNTGHAGRSGFDLNEVRINIPENVQPS